MTSGGKWGKRIFIEMFLCIRYNVLLSSLCRWSFLLKRTFPSVVITISQLLGWWKGNIGTEESFSICLIIIYWQLLTLSHKASLLKAQLIPPYPILSTGVKYLASLFSNNISVFDLKPCILIHLISASEVFF